jgi:Domain of unknown function DUF11/SdrD B-like domain
VVVLIYEYIPVVSRLRFIHISVSLDCISLQNAEIFLYWFTITSMKKQFLSLVMSALLILSIGWTTYASEDVVWITSLTEQTTMTDTTTPTQDVVNTDESLKQNNTIVAEDLLTPDTTEKIAALEALAVWQADVYVKKTASIISWSVWDTVVYTITYGNSWDNMATWVILTERFPSFVSWNLAWWTNTTSNVWMYNLPDLAPWAAWTITIVWTIIQGSTFGSNVINVAEIATTTPEYSSINNQSIAQFKAFAVVNTCNCTGNNSLRWVIYIDGMRDNMYNAWETLLSWITVNLYTSWGSVLYASTVTNTAGSYDFSLLPNGTYDVSYVTPVAWLTSIVSNVWDKWWSNPTVTQLTNIALSGGVTWLAYNFGLIGTNTVKGTIYVDVLRNNILDTTTDTKVQWVTVNLLKDGVVIYTTTTDINGGYEFWSLPNGAYDVSYVTPVGWLTSIVSNVWDKWWSNPTVTQLTNIALSGGVTWLAYNFGLIPTQTSWGGGWFGGGVTTPPTPVVPTTPTTPTTPVIPITPSIPLPPLDSNTNTPLELLETGPVMLLATGPDVAEEIAVVATKTKAVAKTIVQNIQLVKQSVVTPLQYVDVTRWFDAMVYAIIKYSMYMIVAVLVAMMSIYAAQVYARD